MKEKTGEKVKTLDFLKKLRNKKFKNNETEMDETDYLLSTEANKKKLLEGVRQAEAGETISVNEELEK